MARDKIVFQANIPQEVTLEYSEGKFTEGQFGDQYYYSLAGGRCMYVPPVVYKQILDLDIRPGELIIVCKSVTKEGRSSVTRWLVRRAETAGQLAVPRVTQPVTQPMKEPVRDASVQNVPAPAARPSVESAASEAASHPQSKPFLSPTRQERMTQLLADSIRAVKDAASQTGTQLDGAQFQDLVTTMVIDDQKREEHRLRYGFATPAPQPRVNGATTWNGHAQ